MLKEQDGLCRMDSSGSEQGEVVDYFESSNVTTVLIKSGK